MTDSQLARLQAERDDLVADVARLEHELELMTSRCRSTEHGQGEEISKLRRNVAQQLTRTNELVNAARVIDRDYFGDRFFSAAEGHDFFHDITVARQVLEALADELTGVGAFADSPVLRDAVHNLVAALESLRDQAIDIERRGLAAVGLGTDVNAFAPRSFPENNPFACLQEGAGLVGEVETVVQRTAGRLQALMAMVDNADQVRTETMDENEELRASAEDVARAARQQLEEQMAENGRLREAIRELQDQHEAGARVTHAQVDRVKHVVDGIQDARRADLAEVRSLAGEVCQLAHGLHAEHPDLGVPLDELESALSAEVEISRLVMGIESLLLAVVAELGTAAQDQGELDDLRTAVNAAHEQMAAQEAAVATADADLLAAREHIAELEAEIARMQATMAEHDDEIAHLRETVDDEAQRREAAEEALAQAEEGVRDERERAAVLQTELRSDMDEREQAIQSLHQSLAVVQDERAAAEAARQAEAQALIAAEQAVEDSTLRHQETAAVLEACQRELNGVVVERDTVSEQVLALEGRLDEAAGRIIDLEDLLESHVQERAALQERMAEVESIRQVLAQDLDRTRTAVDAGVNAVETRNAALQEEVLRFEAGIAAIEQERSAAEESLAEAREETARLADALQQAEESRSRIEAELGEVRLQLDQALVHQESTEALEAATVARSQQQAISEELEERLAAADAACEAAVARCRDLEAERAQAAAARDALAVQVGDLEERLNLIREDADGQARVRVQELEQCCAGVEVERDALRSEVEALAQELHVLRGQEEDLAQNTRAWEERCQAAEQQATEQQAAYEDRISALEEVLAEFQAAQEQLASAESEREELRAKTCCLTQELDEERASREALLAAQVAEERSALEQALSERNAELAQERALAFDNEAAWRAQHQELRDLLTEARDAFAEELVRRDAAARAILSDYRRALAEAGIDLP